MSHVNCGSTYLFFFNDTATTEIYTLSLHDALPIYEHLCTLRLLSRAEAASPPAPTVPKWDHKEQRPSWPLRLPRSEEHTSELQSRQYLVCRLLLEKKKEINFLLDYLSLHLAVQHIP